MKKPKTTIECHRLMWLMLKKQPIVCSYAAFHILSLLHLQFTHLFMCVYNSVFVIFSNFVRECFNLCL